MPPVSKAQKSARDKYDANHFESFTVKIKKSSMRELQALRAGLNEPRNRFIQNAIDERIERMKGS